MTKRVTFLTLAAAAIFMMCCQNPKPTQSIPASQHSKFSAGQEWCFQRLFVVHSDSGASPWPFDTIAGFFNYKATGDTLIGDKIFTLISASFYEKYLFDVYPFSTRYAAYWGEDSVLVYEFKGLGMLPPGGLFKSKSSNADYRPISESHIAMAERKLLAKMAASGYDTSRFTDDYVPFVFNLDQGQTYYYRTAGDLNGNEPVRRVYVGKESVVVPGGTFDAWKFQWVLPDGLFLPDSQPQFAGYIWATAIGAVKTTLQFPHSTATDELGHVIGIYSLTETSEYLGPFNVNADTILPPKTMTPGDMAFADAHFNAQKYAAWADYVVNAPFTDVILSTFNFNLDSTIRAAGAKTTVYYQSILEEQAVQGWDDVTPDMVHPDPDSFHYIKNHNLGTGNDAYFRALAIDSIVLGSNYMPLDTIWSFYQDSAKTIPYLYGKSDNQIAFKKMLYD